MPADTAHPLSPRFQAAFDYAYELHHKQSRKGTETPYLSHLLAVTALVLEHSGSEDEAIAALLHDGPEDQGGEATLTEIEHRFGEEVATIVRDCSDTFETPKPAWKKRKTGYVEHLRTAGPSTLLVSMADKTHNLERIVEDARPAGAAIWDRFGVLTEEEKTELGADEARARKRSESIWYYAELIAVYRARAEDRALPLVERLEAALAALRTM